MLSFYLLVSFGIFSFIQWYLYVETAHKTWDHEKSNNNLGYILGK